MNLNQALKLAIDALEKEWRYTLYVSDSDVSNEKLIELGEAVKLFYSMLEEE